MKTNTAVETFGSDLRDRLEALFIQAQRMLRARRGDEALVPLREILKASPGHPDAINLTSVAFGQIGMVEEAEKYSRQAVALKPDDAGFQLNLANRLNDQKRTDEAISAYRKAIKLAPDNIAALKSYMRCLAGLERLPEACDVVDQLVGLIQDIPADLAECATVYGRANDHRRALDLYQQAIKGEPDHVEWLAQIARLAMRLDQLELVITISERVIDLTEYPEMRAMLASIMHRTGRLDEMAEHLRAIPEESDQTANAANLMGMMLASQGKLREGLDVMAQIETLAPDTFALQATRLMYLNYDPDLSRETLQQAHRDFGQRFAKALPVLDQQCLALPHDPDRRLRIGFVSPDFRGHSVAYFARPFFDAFDRDRFDVVAYANIAKEDMITEAFRQQATEWHNVFELTDQNLAEQIREDRIDILIDLAGMTRDSRLLAFTARPAPIQMSYIGYPNTTGLPQIDYRITDWIADPENADEDYSETLIRLPGCFLCYAIPSHAPPVESPPCEHRGYITFGSFNNFAKINPEVLSLWADVLNAVPNSRVLLKATNSNDATAQKVILDCLQRHGIEPERIRFADFKKTPEAHLAVYNDIDIALDTFPYNGTTTTCEALWMGVPIITLRGEAHAGRVSSSLLTAVGFEAGITTSREDYVMTAKLIAENPGVLRTAKRTLRDTAFRSPLCDNQAHARTLEQAFRATWRIWCEERAASNEET